MGRKKGIFSLVIGGLAIIYMLNLGAGIGELPFFQDFIPITGNIDEFIASAIIVKIFGGKK